MNSYEFLWLLPYPSDERLIEIVFYCSFKISYWIYRDTGRGCQHFDEEPWKNYSTETFWKHKQLEIQKIDIWEIENNNENIEAFEKLKIDTVWKWEG